MAETTVYSIRVPEEIKERISKNQQESGQSPAEFMARIVAQYEATNYGKSELAALQSAFDVINKVVVGLTAGAAAQATAAAESSACHLAEIDALNTQLNETEAAAVAAAAEAARTIQTLTDQAANLAADLAAARTIQAALAATVTAQAEQITTLQAALAAAQEPNAG